MAWFRRVSALVLFALATSGCASGSVRAAKEGDYKGLGGRLQERIDDGSLSRREVGDIARAIAEREIETAQGKEGVARVRELRACARDLEGALEARAKHGDDVAIEAAWTRALYGDLSASDARDYEQVSEPRLRAIAALGWVRDDDGPARRKAMQDPMLEARRAAMRAAQKVHDPADVPALAEAARLDPDLLVRSEAVRALSAIGDENVAARLRDLWAVGDDGLRGDIAVAWTTPALFALGGHEALRVLLGTQRGAGVIEAAGAVLRMPSSETNPQRELREMAAALFVRSIDKDTRRARLHALATAPLPTRSRAAKSPGDHEARPELPPIFDAVRAAARDEDLEVRVAALSRLLEVDGERDRVIRELEPIAGRDQGRVPRRALFALASIGHIRIQAWLERDLRSSDPEARLSALVGLVALNRAPRGAMLLADADPSARTRAACVLIGAARRR